MESTEELMDGLGHRNTFYRRVFKGSMLVASLLEQYGDRLQSREAAVEFGQQLLESGQIESIAGRGRFDDTAHLYRWRDDIPKTMPPENGDGHTSKHNNVNVSERDARRGNSSAANTNNYHTYEKSRFNERSADEQPRSRRNNHRQSRRLTVQGVYTPDHLREVTAQYHASLKHGTNLKRGTSMSHEGLSQRSRMFGSQELMIKMSDAASDSGEPVLNPHVLDLTLTPSPPPRPPMPDAKTLSEVSSNSSQQTSPDSGVQTVKYDGHEMPALDLENYNIPNNRLSLNGHVMDGEGSIKSDGRESLGISDNEKELLRDMQRMRSHHATVVHGYEARITELMNKMHELRGIAEMLEQAGRTTRPNTPQGGGLIGEPPSLRGRRSPQPPAMLGSEGGPPPAPPPPPLPSVTSFQRTVEPRKSAVKPRVKMRPLFWERILLTDGTDTEDTFWKSATEPNFNVSEFESLFGKVQDNGKKNCLHETFGNGKLKLKMERKKVLETSRSRAVAIKLRSLQCSMADVQAAIYDLNFNKLDLESLQGIYEMRATPEELNGIQNHVNVHGRETLDHPEQFLLQLSELDHFSERVECLILSKRFDEVMFHIERQSSLVKSACKEIRNNDQLRHVLELILALGNYMNGGTQRGQADGFQPSILKALRDVKSMEKHDNLLQYVMRLYIKEHEENAGSNEAKFRLPDPQTMHQAAQVSFEELDADITQMENKISVHKEKAYDVWQCCPASLRQPFQQHMEDFLESAGSLLQRQQQNVATARAEYSRLLRYLAVSGVNDQHQSSPGEFFGTWAKFLEDSLYCWRMEQMRVAKEMYEAIERSRRERMRSMRRRGSAQDVTTPCLKDHFELMRRRSSLTLAGMPRSLSLSSVNTDSQATEQAVTDRPDMNGIPKQRAQTQGLGTKRPDHAERTEMGGRPVERSESLKHRMTRRMAEAGHYPVMKLNQPAKDVAPRSAPYIDAHGMFRHATQSNYRR